MSEDSPNYPTRAAVEATIRFDLDEPEAAKRHLRMLMADKLFGVIHDLTQEFRTEIKHSAHTDTTNHEEAERWRRRLYTLLEDSGISLDDLF